MLAFAASREAYPPPIMAGIDPTDLQITALTATLVSASRRSLPTRQVNELSETSWRLRDCKPSGIHIRALVGNVILDKSQDQEALGDFGAIRSRKTASMSCYTSYVAMSGYWNI